MINDIYSGQRVKVTLKDKKEYIGTVEEVVTAEDLDSDQDELDLYNCYGPTNADSFKESEIESIVVIE